MVVICGTGRSGTSMWMQILADAGMSVLGERFPSNWETVIKAANPQGFFESTLVQGINFTTNPDRKSGARVVPESAHEVVVKIFTTGLRRTERVYIDKVLLTVRHWRAFAKSVHRLHAIQPTQNGDRPETESNLCVWWFMENLAALQDARLRGYTMLAVTYEAALTDPEEVVGRTLRWLGLPESAAQVVNPELCTSAILEPIPDEAGLPPHWLEGFDDFHRAIEDGSIWDPATFQRFLQLGSEIGTPQQP